MVKMVAICFKTYIRVYSYCDQKRIQYISALSITNIKYFENINISDLSRVFRRKFVELNRQNLFK